MKITDKQRIDFVPLHEATVTWCPFGGTWRRGPVDTTVSVPHRHYGFFSEWKKPIPHGRTWRQAVDKAIKAYMGGKK